MLTNTLIGLHALLGEAGALAFLWCLVEVLDPTPLRQRRARRAALLGVALLVASWISGGYYYVDHYGPLVKPSIQAGSLAWAHGIAMELKEHVFLFLPFVGLSAYGRLRSCGESPLGKWARVGVLLDCTLVVVLGFLMAGLGYLVMLGAHVYGGSPA